MRDYNPHLEGCKLRETCQPNGVSDSSGDMTHRSEMDEVNSISFERRRSISREVNNRKHGEVVTLGQKDHGKEGHKASNRNDDKLVE